MQQLIAVTLDSADRNPVETVSYTRWYNQVDGSVHRGTDPCHRFQSRGNLRQQHQSPMHYNNANNEININVKNNKGLDQVPDSPEADLKRLFNPAMVVEDTVPKQTNLPISFSPYRNNQQESNEIQTQIEELIKAGFIRPSHSPYAAPVTLAYKKDEGKRSRLCMDYRKLNEITRKDSTPVPLIDFVIDNLTDAKFFSTLDLTSG
ncbi:retrovirus-related Pol polyprotein from transposon opus [Trichonephila clavipes]|nr:retrovirus-related Pol polyprotein from transposon opus [Trichonephila clavipes]